jgi:hypothetical protein
MAYRSHQVSSKSLKRFSNWNMQTNRSINITQYVPVKPSIYQYYTVYISIGQHLSVWFRIFVTRKIHIGLIAWYTHIVSKVPFLVLPLLLWDEGITGQILQMAENNSLLWRSKKILTHKNMYSKLTQPKLRNKEISWLKIPHNLRTLNYKAPHINRETVIITRQIILFMN